MPIYHKVESQSADWFKMRLGIPTASEFHKIVTPGGQVSKQAEGYAHALLAEMMLGRPLDSVETQYMTRGQDLEEKAITAYEFFTGVETEPGGFVTNGSLTIGCSPDRLIGADGILEMKVPAPNTHVGYLVSRDFGKEKKPQTQGQLFVTGREWVDLMSFHPEMPPLIVRVARDEKYIDLLTTALNAFTATLATLKTDLIAKYGAFPEIVIGAPEAEPERGGDYFDLTDEDLSRMYPEFA